MGQLAATRPVFHSEADFQHALAWLIHSVRPDSQIRLETRPERGIRLDLLATVGSERIAVELKYLVGRFEGYVGGEHYDLPKQGAHDISRHDVVKDIVRLERFVADGFADRGWGITLSNDSNYWRPGWKLDPIDAAFRLQEGAVLEGTRAWSERAGPGTTRKRDIPLELRGRYQCRWSDYSVLAAADAKNSLVRYLAFEVRRPGSAF